MADTEILKQGEWTSHQFRATGAMLVEVLAPPELSAEIAVDGLSGSLRSQSPQSGAFPLQAVSESASVLAVSQAGAPFPGGARVDLSIAFPSIGRSFLIQGLDIAGHERAVLVRLAREGDAWQLRPQTEPPTGGDPEVSRPEPRSATPPSVAGSGPGTKDPSSALGAWAARRAAEIGIPAHPRVAELIIDTSVSMAQHRSRVERLCRFVTALARATGATEPRVREMAVGGYAAAGVGSSLSGATESDVGDLIDDQERKAVITDLPLLHEGVECLVIGDPAIVDVLSTSESGVHVPDEGAWQELNRDDVSYTDQTLQRLEALMRWLSLPASETQERP